ncbi:hypothetical protein B0H15DRAFT_184746 [Mycena belliarum]|uniref:CFEM domain-containing protein n=1 Tax=Mycena belliarum TaxID=1033014 RepID=A0AAD6UBJ6_9AGAR|nr:hypothetical protein B0H15DRAFT_184746 [Mycena belliae]
MLAFLPTLVAGLALSAVHVAALPQDNSGGLSTQQMCLLNCSTSAVTASKCDIEDTACVCKSTTYITNVTTCAGGCGFNAATIQGFLTTECPSGHVQAAAVQGGKNTGGATALRMGTAAASAAGLVLYALLV